MIVRQFLCWIQTAPPGDRADATSALARAYLYSDLAREDRLAAEAAMIGASRRPIAARAPRARRGACVLRRGTAWRDSRARPRPDRYRRNRRRALAGAERGRAHRSHRRHGRAGAMRGRFARAAFALARGGDRRDRSRRRLSHADRESRRGADGSGSQSHRRAAWASRRRARTAACCREDLAVETRQALVAKLSDTLARFVAHREWLPEERAHHVAREACDRVTVAIAAETDSHEVTHLVHHLVASGQLTGGLMLRALIAGNVRFLIEALAELSSLKPAARGGDRRRSLRPWLSRALPESRIAGCRFSCLPRHP